MASNAEDHHPSDTKSLSKRENVSLQRGSQSFKHNSPAEPEQNRQKCPCASVCCTLLNTLALLLFVTIYIILPLLFNFSKGFQRAIFFWHTSLRKVPSPKTLGLPCAHAFHLTTEQDHRLGVWHIPPHDFPCNGSENGEMSMNRTADWFDADERLVLLYFHGMRGSIATSNRITRYKIWSTALKWHVIAFDYRGFGPKIRSHGPPSIPKMTEDGLAVYNWLLASGLPPNRIIFWSHSLGTAIAIRSMSTLSWKRSPLAGILEAPMTEVKEAIMTSRLLIFLRIVYFKPLFNFLFLKPLITNPGYRYNSIELLPRVKCPLLILNSQDDTIIAPALGKKLYEAALHRQPYPVNRRARYVTFPKAKTYGHCQLVEDPQIPKIITNFLHSNLTK